MVRRLLWMVLTMLGAVSCQHKELSAEDPCVGGDMPIKVVVHWGDPSVQARSMRINLFSQTRGVDDYGRDNVPIEGVKYIYLEGGAGYRPFCYDYNVPNIYFRGETDINAFEAYFSGMVRSTYDSYASPVTGEPTFRAPADGEFYVHAWTTDFDVLRESESEQVLDFYPKNILRQFTYRINNILGQENIRDARGAASGMAASYIFRTDSPTRERSTMLFGSVRHGYDAVNQNGYLEGEFYTFGPMAPYQNRFTMEVYSAAGKYHNAYWDVSGQVGESMEDREAKLARDGYDILLTNDPEKDIPELDPGEGSGGGFDIGVGEWGDEVIVEL